MLYKRVQLIKEIYGKPVTPSTMQRDKLLLDLYRVELLEQIRDHLIPPPPEAEEPAKPAKKKKKAKGKK